ncbi:MAG: DUF512 domain-containing protein [Coriobacteriia bacterium]|nr:DUF512 domain-containing protein [Coriobacteriia bacterium]
MHDRRYGEPHPVGGRIARVAYLSDAWHAGLRKGDVVAAVDGSPVADVLDWQWKTSRDRFRVEVLRGDARLEVEVVRQRSELGVAFEAALFDGVRECTNACSFCFVRQLPPGLRGSLYVRDDDFRLSFMHGTFITLTNLAPSDVDRIVSQRLSPLYVSLHASDPAVRRQLICPKGEDHALDVLDELLEGGIQVHVQIVAVPGVNDGAVLEDTLAHLRPRPGVASVGVVPVGFTSHQRWFAASYDARTARVLLDQVGEHQLRCRTELGRSWVYAADEFYLLAGAPFPPAADYDGFPQYENGIGLVRSFLDEWASLSPARVRPARPVVIVTGEMFAPVLGELLAQVTEPERVRVLAVPNRLLGGNVAVAGLLGGEDIADAIARDGAAGTYLVPDVVLNSDGLTLDDLSVREVRQRSHARVRTVAASAAGLVRVLARL